VSVIPCGVNLNLFHPLNKLQARQKLGLNSGKIILFVGRIERLKGIEKIIRAMPYLNSLQPQLMIVGEDGNRPGEIENLKKLARDLKVADSIKFTGLIDYEKLPDYYNAADVCVFPSYYESFGLVPLESLACGTPVIATDVGELSRIIRQAETGYVLPEAIPEILAEKIQTVLTDNSVKMPTVTIRNSVKAFGWERIAGEIDQEIDRLIVKNAVPAL
jgi:D-inositol-3-phosphate glycosyltransferase